MNQFNNFCTWNPEISDQKVIKVKVIKVTTVYISLIDTLWCIPVKIF